MALPNDKDCREYEKFRESGTGKSCVAVCGDDGGDLKAEIGGLGNFAPKVISVGSTVFTLSATTGRSSVSIHNKGAETLYIGGAATVTADDTATGGWEVPSGFTFNINLDDTVTLYLIFPTITATVKVLEQ